MAKCPLADGFLEQFKQVITSPADREALMLQIRRTMDERYRNLNTRATYFTEIRSMLEKAGASSAELDHLTLTPEDYVKRASAEDRRLGLRQLSAFRLVLRPREFLESAMRAISSKNPVTRLLGVQALTARRNIEIFSRGTIEADRKYPGWAWFEGQAKAVEGAPPFLIPLLHPDGFEVVNEAWLSARRELHRQGVTEEGEASSRLQQVALAAVLDVFGQPFTSTHLLRSAAAAYAFHWLKPPMTKLQWFGLILGHRVQRGGQLVVDRQTAEAYEKWDIEDDGELPAPISLPHLSVLLPDLIAPPDPDEIEEPVVEPEPPIQPEPTMPSKPKPQPRPTKKTAPKKKPAPTKPKASPSKPGKPGKLTARPKKKTPAAPTPAAAVPLNYSEAIGALRASAASKREQAKALIAEAEAIDGQVKRVEDLAQVLQGELAQMLQGALGSMAPATAAATTAPAAPAAAAPPPAAPAAPSAPATPPIRPLVPPPVSTRSAPNMELAMRLLANGPMLREALFEAMTKAQIEAGKKPMPHTAFDMFLSRQTRSGALVKTGVAKSLTVSLPGTPSSKPTPPPAAGGPVASTTAPAASTKPATPAKKTDERPF